MKHVRIRLTAGGDEGAIHPMYDIWANADFIKRSTALQWNFTGDALGILHYAVGDADAFATAIESIPEVLGYEIVPAGRERFYVYIRDATTEGLDDLFAPITRSGIVVAPPIRYHENGTVTVSLFGPDNEIQTAIDHVTEPVDVSIEAVTGLESMALTAESQLSRRQREAVRTAVELGDYDIPRTASH
jgi:predicted DNA binding protein